MTQRNATLLLHATLIFLPDKSQNTARSAVSFHYDIIILNEVLSSASSAQILIIRTIMNSLSGDSPGRPERRALVDVFEEEASTADPF